MTAACPRAPTAVRTRSLRERVPQGHKVALADLAEGAPVLRYNVVIGYALKALPAGSWVNEQLLAMPAPPALEDLPIATVKAPLAPRARGLHLRGLPQSRRLGRHAQHPRRSPPPCNASPASSSIAVQRIKAELLPHYPECRRRGRPRAHLWLRRRHRCARRRDPDPHAAQHQPQSELRRRGDGRQPRLREAAARAAAAAGHRVAVATARRRGARTTTSSACRTIRMSASMSMIDSIMRTARAASAAPERAPARDLSRPASWWSACSAAAATRSPGVTANPAVGFCSDLLVRAGATVMFSESDRGARRRRPAHRARRHAGSGATR